LKNNEYKLKNLDLSRREAREKVLQTINFTKLSHVFKKVWELLIINKRAYDCVLSPQNCPNFGTFLCYKS